MNKPLAVMVFVSLLLAPGAASAQLAVGAQGSFGDDFDLGIGGRASYDMRQVELPVVLIGSFDYFFPDEDVGIDPSYWEANLNAGFINQVNPRLATWVGAGLNYANFEANGRQVLDRFGLNLLGGARVDVGDRLAGLGEVRIEI
ncbi:MAG: hypothetical protein GWN99_20265, partial [Gemmatimonadetes bacterium]|nr:hypothetical protein [Gemmatimonadota bacterium]NIR76539.1 hypothetical protein [Candidatus Kutchimonas denitrificans]NIS03357.1 hypothetical protein [Gemmatimonadota bacterium]NIT69218.1 hypothetical protein [Gemmatimonadota bacterium]NIU54610.1 hypothetical protein [Gemmatimonadota bacterium]